MSSCLNGKSPDVLLKWVISPGVVLSLLCMVSCESEYNDPEPSVTSARTPAPAFRLQVPESMYSNTTGKLTTPYCMSFANPDQVPDFVRQNRTAFGNVAELRQYTARFSQLVSQAALRAPTYQEAYQGAMNVAGSDPDLGAMAPKVAQSITSGFSDLLQLSNCLTELANSVGGLLESDDQAYRGTTVYQLMKLAEQMGLSQSLGPLESQWRVMVFNDSYRMLHPLVAMASR